MMGCHLQAAGEQMVHGSVYLTGDEAQWEAGQA